MQVTSVEIQMEAPLVVEIPMGLGATQQIRKSDGNIVIYPSAMKVRKLSKSYELFTGHLLKYEYSSLLKHSIWCNGH